MTLNDIADKFQNYTYNDTRSISEYLTVLKESNTLDENNVEIQEYLLPEILILLKKAILNKFSSDLLFQKNYWSWGFVSLYYSNFFLAQLLNRLKGNFFTRIDGIKNIYLDISTNKYILININTNSRDTHKKELEKLRENYLVFITDTKYRKAIPDDYTRRPFFNESKIRNDINYTLKYYKEFDSLFYENIDIKNCKIDYTKYKNFSINEFRILEINNSRFQLSFDILSIIQQNNSTFKEKYNEFITQLRYKMMIEDTNQFFRYFKYFIKKEKFHISSKKITIQFEGLL